MNITLTINKRNIMLEVCKITAYTGAKSGNIEKISLTEDESNILDSYCNEAIGSLADIISTYGSVDNDTISFNLPSNWKETVRPVLEKNMYNYLINYICFKWFNLTKKDDMDYYAKMIESLSINIIKLLCERIRPKR